MTSPTPDPNTKKRKRIAPTLIKSFDPVGINASNRDVAPNIAPGVVFIGADGKKRMVPKLLAVDDAEGPSHGQPRAPALQALDAGGERALAAAKGILEVAQKKKFAMRSSSLSAGYLGKENMSVDDVFYGAVEVGQELPNAKESTDFIEPPNLISSGRRLYVHRLMKHFLLRSDRQIFSRNGKQYSAIRPYATHLAPRYHNPSFTLYHAGEDCVLRARREALQSWPEIDTEQLVSQAKPSDNSILFNPGPWEAYDEEYDPDALVKWKHIPGGDQVLPVYGESDEENEYDEETWKEIEEEQGGLEEPLKALKRPPLSPEEVDQAIDEGIAEMVKRWHDVKLPKKQRKGSQLWKDTRPRSIRQANLERLRKHVEKMQARIHKMRTEIMRDDTWTSKRQILKQTRIMEVSIFDRESSIWEISIIENQTRPEKPLAKPPSSKNSIVSSENGEEGESIGSNTESSSSEDDMDDFIVDDHAGSEDEIELNMADSEDEDEGNVISPVSSRSPSLDSKSSRVSSMGRVINKPPHRLTLKFRPSNMDRIRPDDDASGIDPANSPSERFNSPNSFSQIFLVKKESSRQKSRTGSPNHVSNIVDLTMTSSDEASRADATQIAAPRATIPHAISLITPKKKTSIKLVNKNSPFGKSLFASPIMVSDEDHCQMPDPDNLPFIYDPDAVAKFPPKAWIALKDRKRLLIAILHSMESSLRSALYVFISNLTEDQFWLSMAEVMNAILHGSDSLKGVDQETFKTVIRFIRLFQMYVECKERYLEKPPKEPTIEYLKSAQKKWFPEFYQFCCQLEDLFFNATASRPHQAVNDQDDDEDDEGPQSAVKRRRVM